MDIRSLVKNIITPLYPQEGGIFLRRLTTEFSRWILEYS
jgi:hypothetical protein